MRLRILVSLMVSLLSVSLFAQTNEFGVFVNHSSLSSTSELDPDTGITTRVRFNSRIGYGVSFSHFVSPTVAVQLSGQTIHANTKLELTGGGLSFSENAGSIDLKQYDAALHWYLVPQGSIRAYVGAGIARIQGGKLNIPADLAEGLVAETISLDSKTTWLADAGVDIRVSGNADITVAAKYTRYSTHAGGSDPSQSLKLDPLTVAAGIGWRF